MFQCPHCGKAIEVEQPAEVPWYKYEPSRGVSLGCGTLIMIAIIVAMFSNAGTGGNAGAIRELQKEIQTLEQKIDAIAENQE
jgi:hypothetical protein